MQQVPVDSIVWAINYVCEWVPCIGALLVTMLVDIVTGLIAAAMKCEVNSAVSQKGMQKKGVMILMVCCCRTVEPYSGKVPVGSILALWFVLTELISIFENADRMGIDLPVGMKDYFKSMRKAQEAAFPVSAAATAVNANHISNMTITVPAEAKPGESGVLVTTDARVTE